jgi:hypothetical protein
VYARWLPWREQVAVITGKVTPLQVDIGLEAHCIRIVNNTGGALYYLRDSTVTADNADGAVRADGIAVLNFDDAVKTLNVLPQFSGVIDVLVSEEQLPDVPQSQELTRWSEPDVQILRNFNATLNQVLQPITSLADFAGIFVSADILASGNDAQIDVNWYADAAGTILLGTDSFIWSHQWLFQHFFPGKGPYYSIVLETQVGSQIAQIAWMRSNRLVEHFYTQNQGSLSELPSTTLPAGVSSITIAAPYKGQAYFHMSTGAATFNVLIVALDRSGTILGRLGQWNQVDYDAVNGNLHAMIHVPAQIVQVTLKNNDGVNRAFFYSLIAWS